MDLSPKRTESKSNICVKLIEEDYKLQSQDVWFGYYENNSYTLDGHKYAIQNIYYDNKNEKLYGGIYGSIIIMKIMILYRLLEDMRKLTLRETMK